MLAHGLPGAEGSLQIHRATQGISTCRGGCLDDILKADVRDCSNKGAKTDHRPCCNQFNNYTTEAALRQRALCDPKSSFVEPAVRCPEGSR